ncbi:ABC transporter permease [Planotetraspora sp. A-T 1434]|uniref:ABC transporter permease n=1 Tax=Planotetraspora sp. A-T 1434 TaxID=2979219 RepID=UPI0021BFBE8E|nr:ABC transporter permease [Planotetraspora sp. A-T 1434]MCT9934441.1 ABC transporter permease [Planotetraspora sp. A-T 1434]
MRRFLLRRLATIPLTLFAVSLLVYAATELVPGDVARTILGREASPASVAALRAQLGLDRPVVQRYLDWLSGFLTGRWGDSYTLGAPVRGLVLDRLGASLLLAGLAFALLVPVALTLGLIAGVSHDRPADRVISVTGLTLGAVPEFVTGVVLLVVFAVRLHWLPASAQAPEGASPVTRLGHLVLPALSLVLLCMGYVARHVRASTVASVESPYARAAALRGATRAQVVRRHVLRNSTVPATSALGVQLQFLLGGLVSVELLFNYPGVGALLLQSAVDKDLPTLQAVAMVLGVLYMLIVLAADLTYRLLDPRVRLGEAVA